MLADARRSATAIAQASGVQSNAIARKVHNYTCADVDPALANLAFASESVREINGAHDMHLSERGAVWRVNRTPKSPVAPEPWALCAA
jgi:hypothetical protein